MPRPLLEIETERLRPYEPGDIDRFVAIQQHADVSRYLYWGAALARGAGGRAGGQDRADAAGAARRRRRPCR